jgi:hypothetical protein
MSRPFPRPTAARPARAALAGLVALCCALPSWALRPVRVYEVALEQLSPAALQNAMRQALVRATGRRESADDPALGSVIADAARYVQSYSSGPHGEPQVVFDAAAVGHALEAAGRAVWAHERPFTLIVLYPPLSRADAEAARGELERAATERGLPISVIPLPVVDAAGNPVAADQLLQSAQRYGGDQVLVGRADAAVSPGQLQWTLYTRAESPSWTGTLSAGVDHTVDLLAPPPGVAAAADAATRVRIEGISGLADCAAVERVLQSIPGVRRADLAEIDGSSATFEIDVSGGSGALERELGGTTHMVRVAGTGSLVYRYQPQG